MALSEIPGRQSDAIEPIERAIGIAGEVPELLDTKAVVLMRAGRLDDAKAISEKAISELDDPRFQFHLIVTLLAQNREADARRKWDSQKLDDLGPEGLMPSEVETLNQLKQKFGSANDPSKTL
jgi:Flp pilus assembly protein TadD